MLIAKKNLKISNPFFDPSLTPQNAKEKGYKYIDDVIYDLRDLNDVMLDILEFLREFQCKLGIPREEHALDEYFGLYIPINENP